MKYFDDLDEVLIDPAQAAQLEQIDGWLDAAYFNQPATPRVLIVNGEPECGKSYMLGEVMKEIAWRMRDDAPLRHAESVRVNSRDFSFKTAGLQELFSERAGFGDRKRDAEERLKALADCHLLFIDELGVERDRLDLYTEGLCALMDARASAYTIFATNLSATSLAKKYGDEPRVISRILSPARVITLAPVKWRSRQNQARIEQQLADKRQADEVIAAAVQADKAEREAQEQVIARNQALADGDLLQAWIATPKDERVRLGKIVCERFDEVKRRRREEYAAASRSRAATPDQQDYFEVHADWKPRSDSEILWRERIRQGVYFTSAYGDIDKPKWISRNQGPLKLARKMAALLGYDAERGIMTRCGDGRCMVKAGQFFYEVAKCTAVPL